MGTEFTRQVSTWGTFYVLAGEAAATLLGLLFVAMTLRPSEGRTDADKLALWAVAFTPMLGYLNILFLALVFAMPDPTTLVLGLVLLGACLVTAALTLAVMLDVRRHERAITVRPDRSIAALPLLCYLTQGAVGLALLGGHTAAFAWVAWSTVLLLLNASAVAWGLIGNPIFGRVQGINPALEKMADALDHDESDHR
jgi:hypothetical protein